jgi:hypothetical protein
VNLVVVPGSAVDEALIVDGYTKIFHHPAAEIELA